MWQIIDIVARELIKSFISVFTVYYLGKIFLRIKKQKVTKNMGIGILISLIFYTIICLNINGIIKTVLLSVINILIYKYIFKTKLLNSIILMFTYTIITLIVDLLNLFIMTELLGFSKYFCYDYYAGSLTGNLVVCTITIVISHLIRKPIEVITDRKISNNLKIVVLSTIALISILLFFYTTVKEFEFNDNVIMYLFTIFSIIYILLCLIKQTFENNKLSDEYDKLLEFMTTYENEIENQRILRHEIKNEFRTIRAKICDKQKNVEIIEYIDEIVNEKYEVNREKYAKFGYLPPNGIKGLFYFKTQEAENKGIKVSINISKKLKNSTIYNLSVKQQRDFGRIVGVFLDNAIEASVETNEKQIGIEVYVNDEGEVKLIISNTYNNQIDKTKLGIESFSTKGKTRGHGLLLVKQLIKKNDVFDMETDIQNNIYIQTLKVKKIIEG